MIPNISICLKNDGMQRYVLLLEEVHKLDLTVPAEIPLELLFVERIKVLDVANVYISCSARVHSQSECWRDRARILTPSNLQPPVVERQTLIRGDLEEGERRSGINEGDELRNKSVRTHQRVRTAVGKTHRDVLVRHVSQTLENTSADCVAQVFGRRLRVNVAKVNSPVQALLAQVVERISRREGQVWRQG